MNRARYPVRHNFGWPLGSSLLHEISSTIQAQNEQLKIASGMYRLSIINSFSGLRWTADYGAKINPSVQKNYNLMDNSDIYSAKNFERRRTNEGKNAKEKTGFVKFLSITEKINRFDMFLTTSLRGRVIALLLNTSSTVNKYPVAVLVDSSAIFWNKLAFL